MDIIGTARRALELYREADEMIATVKEAIASSKEALSTDDQTQLNQLLAEAQDRRRKAQSDLDEALASLG